MQLEFKDYYGAVWSFNYDELSVGEECATAKGYLTIKLDELTIEGKARGIFCYYGHNSEVTRIPKSTKEQIKRVGIPNDPNKLDLWKFTITFEDEVEVRFKGRSFVIKPHAIKYEVEVR